MTESGNDSNRFAAAIEMFDRQNAADPNIEFADGAEQPRELMYARRLTDWVLRLEPSASEVLRLAARCQHLCRWEIPRESYPLDRAGYLRWRAALKEFHARKSSETLRQAGYPEETIARVRDLNLKRNFPTDHESRVLEDALCLVFLEHQFAALARKTSEEKMLNALRKSWAKMSPPGRAEALMLNFGPAEKALLEKALAGTS